MQVIEKPQLGNIAEKVRSKLKAVIASLGGLPAETLKEVNAKVAS